MPLLSSLPTPAPSSSVDTSSSVVSIDPTLLAALPLAGVMLTIAAGLLGAWIQSAREHRKWLRESRYVAYLAYLKISHEIIRHRGGVAKDRAELARLSAEVEGLGDPLKTAKPDERAALLAQLGLLERETIECGVRIDERTEALRLLDAAQVEAAVAFSLLGPRSVHEKSDAFSRTHEPRADTAALAEVERAMRGVLKINY